MLKKCAAIYWRHFCDTCHADLGYFARSRSYCRGSSAALKCSNEQRSRPARSCRNSRSQSCTLLSTPTSSLPCSTSNTVRGLYLPVKHLAHLFIPPGTLFVREEYVDQLDIDGIEEINEAYSKVFKLYEEYTADKT